MWRACTCSQHVNATDPPLSNSLGNQPYAGHGLKPYKGYSQHVVIAIFLGNTVRLHVAFVVETNRGLTTQRDTTGTSPSAPWLATERRAIRSHLPHGQSWGSFGCKRKGRISLVSFLLAEGQTYAQRRTHFELKTKAASLGAHFLTTCPIDWSWGG